MIAHHLPDHDIALVSKQFFPGLGGSLSSVLFEVCGDHLPSFVAAIMIGASEPLFFMVNRA
jgi:hypothetical protein